MSRELTGKRYNDFTKARQVNFLGHKMRFPQKFHDWLVRDAAATWMEPGAKVDKSAIEAFTFLAYEAVGQIVEMSLLAREKLHHRCILQGVPSARELGWVSNNQSINLFSG